MSGLHLGTIRGQLVLWYLSVLAILLIVLGAVQYVTLRQYLQSNTAASLRHGAEAELRVLSPCYITSPSQLMQRAQTLAELLGSHEIAVKIVQPSGVTLADHGMGQAGAYRPLNISASTIRQLIASARPVPLTGPAPSSCGPGPTTGGSSSTRQYLVTGNVILVAVAIGESDHPVGYAILGRSFSDPAATIQRTEFVFGAGAAIALVLAATVAWPLINSALRPLRTVADTASAIAEGDLQQRANLAQSPDEIGRLGRSFDRMVDRLEEAITAANASEDRMRQFLADASHELRTPLTVLRGTSEVLLRQAERDPAELAAGLRAMNEEAVRLSTLVNDLLTLTRVDSGQTAPAEAVPLRQFVEQYVDQYAAAWPDRRIDVALDDVHDLEVLVAADALRRIITNLVDNAARYSAPGAPITVGGNASDTTVTFKVQDAGPGLAPQDATRVFERFYRGARSRSRQTGGSGLGLAIVSALVSQNGGEVTIDTAPDRGTTVAITLPRAGLRDA